MRFVVTKGGACQVLFGEENLICKYCTYVKLKYEEEMNKWCCNVIRIKVPM